MVKGGVQYPAREVASFIMDEVLLSEETARTRVLKGPLAAITRALLILVPVLGVIFLLDVPQRIGWLIFGEQYM